MTVAYDFFQYKNNFVINQKIKSISVIQSSLKTLPFITFVIPTYKKREMLLISLKSILHLKGIDQCEIVVVNDDPEDTELEKDIRALHAFNIQYYINEKNLGLFDNWNRCFELARGEWVALLNDDDYLYNFYLEDILKILKLNEKIQYLYVGHDIANVKSPEHAEGVFTRLELQAQKVKRTKHRLKDSFEKGVLLSKVSMLECFMLQDITHPLGTLIRKDRFLKSGGYNKDFYPSSDWVFNINFLMENNIYLYNQSLGCRSEGINLSSNIRTRVGFIEMDYMFRRPLAKQIKLPFTDWYNNCLLNSYARRLGVIHKVNIRQIKKCTDTDISRYRKIRLIYRKINNIFNYIMYYNINKNLTGNNTSNL